MDSITEPRTTMERRGRMSVREYLIASIYTCSSLQCYIAIVPEHAEFGHSEHESRRICISSFYPPRFARQYTAVELTRGHERDPTGQKPRRECKVSPSTPDAHVYFLRLQPRISSWTVGGLRTRSNRRLLVASAAGPTLGCCASPQSNHTPDCGRSVIEEVGESTVL